MKRVLLFSSHTLFSEGIKNLLDSEADCEVIGWETNIDDAVKRIQELQPDAILVINLGSSSAFMSDGQRLMRAGKTAKIIELNLGNPDACAYYGEWRMIREVEDLVRAIQEPLSTTSK